MQTMTRAMPPIGAASALNCQPGRWLIDTHQPAAPGHVPMAIEAGPHLAKRQAERSGDCTAEFAPFRQEMEAILARQRAAKAANAPSIELPRPTEPIDADLPPTFLDTLQVVGGSAAGVIILASLIGAVASRALGG